MLFFLLILRDHSESTPLPEGVSDRTSMPRVNASPLSGVCLAGAGRQNFFPALARRLHYADAPSPSERLADPYGSTVSDRGEGDKGASARTAFRPSPRPVARDARDSRKPQ